MKAIDFVKTVYPGSSAFPMIDNRRGQTSYVILKGVGFGLEIITNEGATTASKAWSDAKKFIIEESKPKI